MSPIGRQHFKRRGQREVVHELSSQARAVVQIASRYREADGQGKTGILDEFVAATGYARKYAIRLLHHPAPAVTQRIKQTQARHYGKSVQEALAVAWTTANGICAKRLVPFLPGLVQSLEKYGYLTLTDEVRAQLPAIGPATADRILSSLRQGGKPRGMTTTQAGMLLKHQVPVGSPLGAFADWNDLRPGFFEVDVVVHCGTHAEGTFLSSLVLTDIATGWTECLALRHGSHETVLEALNRVRQSLPFVLLGLDTDNGGEFLNYELLAYCERERVTFTRERAYKKNDQCFVEQKNGSIVRQLVGYDRYEGEMDYRQLTELYRAVRLYVSFFQPSMKIRAKRRDGSQIQRKYHRVKKPLAPRTWRTRPDPFVALGTMWFVPSPLVVGRAS